MQLHHAGIATTDADRLAAQYRDLLGCEVAHTEGFEGMHVVFLDVGGDYFELLEPRDSAGAIASYLEDAGPGIHHLALATADVDGALDRARSLDIDCIDDSPRPGAWGHEVAFLHPADTGQVLLEFVKQ